MAKKPGAKRKKGRRAWGSVREKRKGRRGYGVRYQDPTTGKSVEKWGFPSKELANRYLAKKETELVAQSHGLAPRTIKRVAAKDFFREALELKAVEWAESTKNHAKYTAQLASDFFGDQLVDSIGIPEAQRYVAFLDRERSNKGNTLARNVSLLSGLWERAVELDYARENPWPKIRRRIKGSQEKEIPFISPEKLQEIYDAVPLTRQLPGKKKVSGYRDLIIVLGETGMRVDEAWNLRWRDISESWTELVVRRSKTYKSRTIPLTPLAKRTLKALYKDQPDSDPIFAYMKVKKDSAIIAISRIMTECGYDDVTANTFRHAFAANLMMTGVPITWVQDLLGHSRIQTTLRYARHAPVTAAKEAIAKLAKLRGQK